MSARTRRLNRALARCLGVRIVRESSWKALRREPERDPGDLPRPPADPAHDRLVTSPVFLLSSVRSGSTLLRMILDAHPDICSPHELHLRRLGVNLSTGPVRQSMIATGLNHSDLEHVLWDRLLHRELAASGKRVIVEKTPSNVFGFRRLRTCWPQARFIFLLRHPGSIVESWREADPVARSRSEAIVRTREYMLWLERARTDLDGLEVRYEALTADPVSQTRRICDFLGVEWSAQMLDYGSRGTETVKGIGDWRQKIRTGTVQPGRVLPVSVPAELDDIARTWGYLGRAAG